MNEEGGRHDPIHYYGPWAWIGGLIMAAVVIWIMFAFADGFN